MKSKEFLWNIPVLIINDLFYSWHTFFFFFTCPVNCNQNNFLFNLKRLLFSDDMFLGTILDGQYFIFSFHLFEKKQKYFNAGPARSWPQTLPMKNLLYCLQAHLPMARISVATERNASETTASTATVMFSCFAILRYTYGRIHSSSSPVKQSKTCKNVLNVGYTMRRTGVVIIYWSHHFLTAYIIFYSAALINSCYKSQYKITTLKTN